MKILSLLECVDGRVVTDILKVCCAFFVRVKEFKKVKAQGSFRMLGTTDTMAQLHVPDDWNLLVCRS
jgi:hypothetical protein